MEWFDAHASLLTAVGTTGLATVTFISIIQMVNSGRGSSRGVGF